jgi:hypothetical protein
LKLIVIFHEIFGMEWKYEYQRKIVFEAIPELMTPPEKEGGSALESRKVALPITTAQREKACEGGLLTQSSLEQKWVKSLSAHVRVGVLPVSLAPNLGLDARELRKIELYVFSTGIGKASLVRNP